ncbi:hypothetical protein MBLNU459_g6337t2 [Dothideomycetes sp. NU459]
MAATAMDESRDAVMPIAGGSSIANSDANTSPDPSPRSQSPMVRTRLRERDSGGQASPLRATFTPDTMAAHHGEAPRPATATGAAPTVHFGPPTSADFNLPAGSSFFLRDAPAHAKNRSSTSRNVSGTRTTSGSSAVRASSRPRPFALRHDSDPSAPARTAHPRRADGSGTGIATPPDRKSVQFNGADEGGPAVPSLEPPLFEHAGEEDEDEDEDENDLAAGRQGSFFARLKAMATPTHSRHASEFTNGGTATPPTLHTPMSERDEPRYPVYANSHADGSEAEGDIEESDMDDAERSQSRPRRKQKRRFETGSSTAPSTPRTPRFPSFLRDHSFSGATSAAHEHQPRGLVRRATMTDIPENSRVGVSEDEGRDRLAKSAWRRGLEGARGLSYGHNRKNTADTDTGTPDGRRPNNLRRLTGMAFDGGSSPFRLKSEGRQMSTSAQKWRQVKAGLKLLGQRKKDERVKVDHQKSAELMAELLAGSPAAVFFASMYQRDEHGRRKIPVLLEQLKINIPTSQTREDKSGNRHMVFTIHLEYGNGPSRMTWTIHRSLRDFANLHLKYKFQSQTERYNPLKVEDRTKAKIPRFPRSAFPYLRGVRGFADEDEEEGDDQAIGDASGPDADASGTERPRARRTRTSFTSRRQSSINQSGPDAITSELVRVGSVAGAVGTGAQRSKELYSDRQRKKLEIYLQQMIRWLIFRPDSTRLCKFLELSALSMRLSVEGGYHGKEGLLAIISKPTLDLRRRPTAPSPSKRRPKWFMIRHSYVVCVDAPESLEPREVFLVDSDFTTDNTSKKQLRDQSGKEMAKTAAASAQPKHHLLKLYNSERKLKLLAKNERQLAQFKESIDFMQRNTIWSQKHRFDSFAPVRKNVFARWLVDGRDHMWQVSRAIDNARSFVYIHDWWLSPELYMRRPAAISQKWRLDRLLLRKAQEGVKIFVIVYRNIESAIPIDSEYTKASLLDLHPNICVQRSPNQFRQNQFFWAHHEKLVVVDNAMAFVGGVDLCFGRWDDPSHSLTDDKLTGFELDLDVPRTADNCQVWPGKDYSNPRVQDFYALDRPYEEMYDRTKVPRMPWHDISMTVVGQPARDVARHFVQRWNYVLRQRVPSRPTPVLLPPPEYEQEELERLGMTGTCQIQILRSCTTWSIGTPNKTECSIMNAYCYLIKTSQHFVYIENQFFISSCVVEGTPINNKIGDALVERIELAHERRDNWRACIVIPLMPGFQNSVESQDGTSVRLIMQCQYRSICRGETSIFGRLQAKGINPADYIEFYSLRQWGKIGPRKCLTTEQLYIHAKIMVVDDRTAIIGSANINERSMLGSRDSEVAAIVTDQEMIPSVMGGKPYDVGTFPHTLRMRLMREHLGVDVDEIYRQERDADTADPTDDEMDRIYNHEKYNATSNPSPHILTEQNLAAGQHDETNGQKKSVHKWVSEAGDENADGSNEKAAKDAYERPHDKDVAGYGFDNMKELEATADLDGRDSYINSHAHEVLRSSALLDKSRPRAVSPHKREVQKANEDDAFRVLPPVMPRMNTRELGLTQLSQLPALPVEDDTDIGGPPLQRSWSKGNASVINPLLQSMNRPMIDEDCMRDPLVDQFYQGIWHQAAINNTKLYRQVFRCMPDNEVLSWTDYHKFEAYSKRFMQSQGLGSSDPGKPKEAPQASGPPGSGGTDAVTQSVAAASDKTHAATRGAGSRLSDLAGKLLHRPRSNTSSTTDRSPEMTEKQRQDQPSRASDSPTTNLQDEEYDEKAAQRQPELDGTNDANGVNRTKTIQFPDDTNEAPGPETTATATNGSTSAGGGLAHSTSQKKRRRANTKSSAKPFSSNEEILEKDEAEDLLKLIQGNLVVFPYDWLEKEERGGNWLYSIDQLAPLEIYNGTEVALSQYSYCGGSLNVTAYIANLDYDKIVTLYYTNRQNVSTPLAALSLGYLSTISGTNYELWGADVPVYVDGVTELLNLTYQATDIGETYVEQLDLTVVPSGAAPPGVAAAPVPYATPSGLSNDITHWLQAKNGSESAISKTAMFANINPDIEGAVTGTVVAARSGPSYPQTDPDYEYDWVRDSSLTMDVVQSLYNASSNKKATAFYEQILFEYAAGRATEQNDPGLQTGLGEPKFYLNNTIFRGPWGRPQNDGPATAAITLIEFANDYLSKGGNISTVQQRIYDSASYPTQAPVLKDLLFVASNWSSPSFDLWEEEESDHFYTRMVQRRALVLGAQFATKLGDSATSATLSSAATALTATLSQFWDPNRQLLLYEYGPVLRDKSSYKDIAVVLGIIHGYAGDGVYGYTNDKVLVSAYQISTSFLSIYPIANTTRDASGKVLGIPVGRYPEDVYNGTGTEANGGNPWFLCTASMAEFLYRAVSEYEAAGTLTVTNTSAPFFAYFAPSAGTTVGTAYASDTKVFKAVVAGLEGWGDAFMRRIKYHTPAGGHLSEEFNRNTGVSQGAADLTWSYASVLTASFARAVVAKNNNFVKNLANLGY